ncbi:hypothetical protein [Azospirillum sp.]|uniref:hypothetical protein n=1 Tax=Azospirillum sp. TaxID=34012 RepID=UPI002D5E3B2B|nr:hypothetical protein [Azospirillum sp.]HYD66638.1 hypothetical protein [Azospirillum sp.]
MNAPSNGAPRRRKTSAVVFAVLLLAGLLMLAIRLVARPDVTIGEAALPVLGGIAIAVALAVMVRRDRQDRDSLPAARQDRPDQGSPP